MAGWFILEHQRTVVDVTEIAHFLMCHTDKVGDMVELLLRELAVVNYNGVVKVTTLDEVCIKQRLYFAYKHESTARSYVPVEISNVFQTGVLVCQHGRIVGNHNVD